MRPTPTNEALSAWLDGELDEASIRELEAELARDPALREELEQLEAVVRTLRDEGPLAAPEGFEARVMARIAAEAPVEGGAWAWLRRPFGIPLEGWALGLAAAAVVALLLPLWRAPVGEDEPPRERSPAAVEAPRTDPQEPVARKGPPQASPTEDPDKGAAKNVPPAAEKGVGTGVGGDASGVGKTVPVPVPEGGADPKAPVEPPLAEGADEPPQGTASDAVVLGPEPHQLVVRSRSAAVERDLLAVCGRYFWRCEAAEGATDGKMRASRETVVVSLPPSDLPRLVKELAAMGHDVRRIGEDALMKGSATVEVPVVLQLVGGTTATEPAPVPAARQRFEADAEMDAPEQAAPAEP